MSVHGRYLLFMTLTGKRLDFPSPSRRKAPLGAWPAFERKLAETLGALEEDQYLVVSAKRGWVYVQFAAQGSFGLRAECVGNNYLDEAHALSAGQTALLPPRVPRTRSSSAGWLSFHRSWTGICIYRLRFRKRDEGVEIVEAWVNRKGDEYSCVDDLYDAAIVSWLIDVLLLKRDAPWPESGKGDEPLRQWSLVGRAMLEHDDEGSTAAALDRALRDTPDS